jgi:hypothetical protein
MGILDLQTMQLHLPSMEWTPAAIFLAVLCAGMLAEAVGFVTGKSEWIYKSKMYMKECRDGASDVRVWEISIGGHLMHWTLCAAGALFSGGAQLMSIVMFIPMAICTYYHWVASDNKQNAIGNCVFMAILAYLGFVPMPVVHSISIQWTPAAIFVTVQSVLILLAGLTMLLAPDNLYKDQPFMKGIASRHFDILHGACLIGAFLGIVFSVVAGGAALVCLMELPALCCTCYVHYVNSLHVPAGKNTLILTDVIMVLLLICGLFG